MTMRLHHTQQLWPFGSFYERAIYTRLAQAPGLHALLKNSLNATYVVLPCTHCVTHENSIMSEATFTFRVDEALKNEFATAAKARDRTGAQLLRDFMREFVQKQQEVAEHDAWFRREVQAGLDSANSANAGRLVPASEVEAKFAARRAVTRRPLKTSK